MTLFRKEHTFCFADFSRKVFLQDPTRSLGPADRLCPARSEGYPTLVCEHPLRDARGIYMYLSV
jgi:hypothetical protein